LVLTWIIDLTPEGVKFDSDVSGSKRVFAAAAVLIALALAWYFQGQPAFRKGETIARVAAAAPVAPVVDPRSIAVLPFLNMSDDKNNEYFSDGISEELLNVLVRVKGFNVASRTSSFAFKGREIGTPEIARQLKVRYVLEGSVRKQGDQLRITAQLIDANDDRHVLSETYDRKLADIFKIQDEIANAIVTAVSTAMGKKAEAPTVTVKADTANLNAYDSFLKARELFLARSDLKESVRLYEHAVELDPNFARGWEGLAAAYSVMRGWGIVDRDYLALTDSAAKRALELDPKLSMAWAAMANSATNRVPANWASSIDMLDRAIAVDPHNSSAFLWRSIDWHNLGFFDRAIADQDQCLQLDPHYGNCSMWKALTLLHAGDTERAFALFEQSLLAGYRAHHEYAYLAASIRRGDRMQAAMLMTAWGAKPELERILIDAMSQPDAAHPAVEQVLKNYFSDPKDPFLDQFDAAEVCLWLGDFECVASYKDIGSSDLLQWETEPAGFRNSAGFKKLIVRLGVADYWRKHGYPPQCHAVGANDFTCDAPVLKAAK
jgi:TolB-like protein